MTTVYHQGGISAVVNNQMGSFPIAKVKRTVSAPPVFLKGFPFPCEHGNSCFGFCTSRRFLSGENFAACPADICARLHRGFYQNAGLISLVRVAVLGCSQ